MNNNVIDTIGEVLWFLTFVTPVITVPLVWKFSSQSKLHKILIGLALALLLSFVFFCISLSILFRNGLGPT